MKKWTRKDAILIIIVSIMLGSYAQVLIPYFLIGNRQLESITYSIQVDDKNETKTVFNIMDWIANESNMYNTWNRGLPLGRFPFLTYLCKLSGDPSYVAITRCGTCGEFSSIFMGIANKMVTQQRSGIPARTVFTYTINHEWAEVEIDGKWTYINPSEWPGGPDCSAFNNTKKYECTNNATIEYAFYKDGAGKNHPLTERYNDYVGNLRVLVTSEGKPINNVGIYIDFSYNKNILMNKTDLSGESYIPGIGFGDYHITAKKGLFFKSTESLNVTIDSVYKNITMNLPPAEFKIDGVMKVLIEVVALSMLSLFFLIA